MVQLKKGSIAAAFVAATLCFAPAAFAQQATPTAQQQTNQKFTDAELKQFVEANTKATEIQKEGREALVAAIENENLTVDRFNELAKAHQQKKLQDVAEDTDEIASFSKAAQAIVLMQPENRDKVKQAIEEEGLTVEKYETILKAYEQDEAVQAHVREVVNAAD